MAHAATRELVPGWFGTRQPCVPASAVCKAARSLSPHTPSPRVLQLPPQSARQKREPAKQIRVNNQTRRSHAILTRCGWKHSRITSVNEPTIRICLRSSAKPLPPSTRECPTREGASHGVAAPCAQQPSQRTGRQPSIQGVPIAALHRHESVAAAFDSLPAGIRDAQTTGTMNHRCCQLHFRRHRHAHPTASQTAATARPAALPRTDLAQLPHSC